MKYSRQALRIMARKTMEAKEQEDFRFHTLLFNMMISTGLPHSTIEQKIKEMANEQV